MGVVDIRIFDAIPQFGDFRNIITIELMFAGIKMFLPDGSEG